MAGFSSGSLKRNFPYFRQQFMAVIGNTSIVVKFVCVTVFLCYFLSFNETAIEAISVTPGYLLPPNFRFWTAFTHCFLEIHFWQVIVDVVTLGLCGKLMEPLWGALEMLTFFAVVNVGVAVSCVIVYLIAYMSTFNPDILFDVHIHGLTGYVAAVSVSVKQIMPDHVLFTIPALGKMRNRNIPLLCLLLSIVLWLVGLLHNTYPCMFACGLYISWIYLRFLQYHSNLTRGDMAESFTFASFFPNVLQPPVAIVCNTLFQCLVKLRICKKPVRKYDVGAPSSITISLPGIDPHDAERRRLIALKALSDRLNKSEPAAPWPVLLDDDSSPMKHSKTVTFSKATTELVSIPAATTAVTATATTSTETKINVDKDDSV
ncbi:hypothetical protein CHUAL_005039 [Chamberlinius hualienensis]